ncbi:uncharacterized protein LOC128296643 [Gossypium arboreum]|uniref:uncharacterized protein LOC128296643 n=1 Tax=Gossypium arboreum TaxID=29729 RepID=UPI0022F188DF|nr:uncharacterized protein LOC128296643 [Gossypium arboreum]
MAGEMVENAIRDGKIEGETTITTASRRKDNEVNNTSNYNAKAITISQPRLLYPKWYNANAKCEYHAGISGHSIENCTGFKKAMERLLKMGVVKFDDTRSNKNSLPNHGDQGVNAVGDTGMRRIKEGVAKVRTSKKMIWEEMVRREMIISKERNRGVRDYCEFHAEEGYEIQECDEFKAFVQSLMDNKKLEFYEASSDEGRIWILEGGLKNQNRPRFIISLPRNNEVEIPTVPKVIIHKPVSFPYKDNKRVPWNYNCNVTIPEKEDIAGASEKIQGKGSYIRSGKRYNVKGVRVEPVKVKAFDKGKGVEILVNKPVKEEEAKEFLKFLKHSEYSVVEQLRKQPARISVLALLLSSKVHREALMKVLNETYVTNDISVNKLDRLVSNISADNFIYFNDDKIPPALNVLPLSILNRLPIDSSHMKTCHNVVRAFDGRPWIHSAEAVPSSLHQKLKLVADGRLVTINAEEDIIATVTSDAPYVEANKEVIECSFHSLEFVNATFISEGNEVLVPRIFRTTRMGLQMTMRKGALPGKGLGRHLQGRIQIPELKEKRDHFGLGYRTDHKQRRKEIEKRGIIHPKGGLLEKGSYHINAVHNEESGQGNLEGIRPYEPGSSLNNWVAEEHPDFEDDRDCDMSPDLLRMVKQEEKQILSREKEEIENVALEEGKEAKIGTHVAKETRQGLVELLCEFKDIFAWLY